jgi:hypothetical protein
MAMRSGTRTFSSYTNRVVAEIGFVLAEGFAVIAVDDEERVGVEAAPAEGFEERAEGGVAVMKGVEVLRGFFGVGKRTRLGSGVGMMTGDGEIMEKKRCCGGSESIQASMGATVADRSVRSQGKPSAACFPLSAHHHDQNSTRR